MKANTNPVDLNLYNLYYIDLGHLLYVILKKNKCKKIT